jgi:hypothetical protein
LPIKGGLELGPAVVVAKAAEQIGQAVVTKVKCADGLSSELLQRVEAALRPGLEMAEAGNRASWAVPSVPSGLAKAGDRLPAQP